jgi:hypothetical protein
MQLAREWGEFDVVERTFTLHEVRIPAISYRVDD